MILFMLGLILFLVLTDGAKSNQVTVGGYTTRYFTPQSKATFDTIKTVDFAVAEDEFMECEYLTVHRGVSHLRRALQIHQKMTETFPKLNLSYHNMALNQIGRPSKSLDPNLAGV